MWGTGVPDWGTLPAHLQTELAKIKGQPVCVVNYAEQGWVSTQSVIQLMLLVRAGNLPNLVIFYDGNNDVFAAYQSGAAGTIQNQSSAAARFENRSETPPLIALLSQTATFKFVQRRVLGDQAKTTPPFQKQGIDREALAAAISQSYVGNCRLVQSLGQQYGFKAYFFWQTTLLTDSKALTAEERSIRSVAGGVYPGLEELYRATSAKVASPPAQDCSLHDISDVFKDQPDLIFVDPFHVTIEGNRLIALEMLNYIGQ